MLERDPKGPPSAEIYTSVGPRGTGLALLRPMQGSWPEPGTQLNTMKATSHPRPRAGFTLVEIMLVVAILALTATIAVPNWLRARKRSQATRVLEDLRTLDQAFELYSIEHNRSGTEAVGTHADFLPYLKTGTVLYASLPNDFFGNAFTMTTLQAGPKLSSTTFGALSDIAPQDFWSPYYP